MPEGEGVRRLSEEFDQRSSTAKPLNIFATSMSKQRGILTNPNHHHVRNMENMEKS